MGAIEVLIPVFCAFSLLAWPEWMTSTGKERAGVMDDCSADTIAHPVGFGCVACRVAYGRTTFDEDISAWDTSSVSLLVPWGFPLMLLFWYWLTYWWHPLPLRLQTWHRRKFGFGGEANHRELDPN